MSQTGSLKNIFEFNCEEIKGEIVLVFGKLLIPDSVFSSNCIGRVKKSLPVHAEDVEDFVAKVSSALKEARIKRLIVVGAGEGGVFSQALAVKERGLVRKLVLVDVTTRVDPTVMENLISFLERFLPLGLPLRASEKKYDTRSVLYRISCPSLVVKTRSASPYEIDQGQLVSQRIPNAYDIEAKVEMDRLFEDEEFLIVFNEYLEVPPKRPQKAAN